MLGIQGKLMGQAVCLGANALYYPEGGGHLWVYLNWALGLRAAGCQVIWLEAVDPATPADQLSMLSSSLRQRLAPFALDDALTLVRHDADQSSQGLQRATQADLLVNLVYSLPAELVTCFRRTVLLDIDPGLLQAWIAAEWVIPAPHDLYFTIGERVQPSRVQGRSVEWLHTPPCVSLEHWPVAAAAADAPFTTISHWQDDEWMIDGAENYRNDKRSGFLPFLDVPRLTRQPLELALYLGDDEADEREALLDRGWRVRPSTEVSSTPQDYQRYIQGSRGEFSCCKPSYLRFLNAWISDRTLCYLASGKPAIVQYTGDSADLPDRAGLLRFRTPDEAAECLEAAAADYARHCLMARALAEERFDAVKVATRLLARALP